MRCLLVDDEAGIREGLAALLRLRGHEVHTAADCAAALALLSMREFDVVLTDWRLPDGTGATLYGVGTAPIVAISGHPADVTASPRLAAVLQKPVLPDRLLSLLATVATGNRPAAAAGAPPAPGAPFAALPLDVRTVLGRALDLLGPVAAEVVDDGTYVTLRAPWANDRLQAAMEALGGDLRVLAPAGSPQLELRWCRDGRPEADLPVFAVDGAWPAAGEFAVDAADRPFADAPLLAVLDRAAAARGAGATVWFVNVAAAVVRAADRLGRAADLRRPDRIGPRVPQLLAELWR